VVGGAKVNSSREREQFMAYDWLAPPSSPGFTISVFLALLALLVKYAHVAIPVVSAHTFETLLVAFLLLLADNLFKGF